MLRQGRLARERLLGAAHAGNIGFSTSSPLAAPDVTPGAPHCTRQCHEAHLAFRLLVSHSGVSACGLGRTRPAAAAGQPQLGGGESLAGCRAVRDSDQARPGHAKGQNRPRARPLAETLSCGRAPRAGGAGAASSLETRGRDRGAHDQWPLSLSPLEVTRTSRCRRSPHNRRPPGIRGALSGVLWALRAAGGPRRLAAGPEVPRSSE